MSHQRQVIRQAVVAQLVDKTDADDRVFPTREVPWKRTELPGISVYTLEETVSTEIVPEAARTLQLAVVGVVALTEAVDDALDDLALQVERAICADRSLGGTALVTRLTGTRIEVAEEGGRALGVVRCLFDVMYDYTPEP